MKLLEEMSLIGASEEEMLDHISKCHEELKSLRKHCLTFGEVQDILNASMRELWYKKTESCVK
jgi:hypothetical protein